MRLQVTVAKLQAQAMTRAAADAEILFTSRCRQIASAAGANMDDGTKLYRIDIDEGLLIEESGQDG